MVHAARLTGIHEPREYPIGAFPLVLGRDPGSDVVLSGEDVSRRHAYLLRTPQGMVIVDTSTHGTSVNGDPVQAQRLLAAGDVIQVGGELFRFDCDESPDSASTAQADAEQLPTTSAHMSTTATMARPTSKLAVARALAARPSLKARAAEWIRRYSAGEVAGLAAAIAGSWLVQAATGSAVAAAYGGSIGEAIGFYATIVVREMLRASYVAGARRAPYGFREMGTTWRGLLFEFGPAELFDTGLVRPLAMLLGGRVLGSPLGILAGKVLADLAFYVPVIAMYEIRKGREAGRN